jgi:hypothetical protein
LARNRESPSASGWSLTRISGQITEAGLALPDHPIERAA